MKELFNCYHFINYESQFDIICNWLNNSSKIMFSSMYKKYFLPTSSYLPTYIVSIYLSIYSSLKMQRNLVNLNIGGACHFLHHSLLNFVSFSYLEYRVTHKKPDGNDGGHKEVLDQIDDYGIKIAPRAISSTIKV